ncbi:MAG TPA: hypothetical protein VGO30_20505 [Mycobacterium sp.]|jgi:hypothetical protein|nr:hypothetical protein [Mycobacterium sp.]
MTSQTGRNTGWRRAATGAVASGALAAGLMIGLGSGTASADVLDDIALQYDTGAGGGQVSQLVHTALKMRALGFVPSKGNMEDLQAALDKRPNQVPLVNALQDTVAFQKRNQARGQQQQAPMTIGINQYDPNNPGALGGFGVNPGGGAPGGGINIPLGP